jgi:hypothetical protein
MLRQPLLEKLTRLRLPGFRQGLQEQWENPHYAELAFEERLGMLVDLEPALAVRARVHPPGQQLQGAAHQSRPLWLESHH